jgi:hypothetical protein
LVPSRVRLRRGAWEGSRRAKAMAAACLAVGALTLLAPPAAVAFPCGDPARDRGASQVRPANVSPHECGSPQTFRPSASEGERKKGSISGLTVFVLAVAGALLIPIGRNGIPRSGDPYGHDRNPYPRKETIR